MDLRSDYANEAFIAAMPFVQQGYKVTSISWNQARYFSPNELVISLRKHEK